MNLFDLGIVLSVAFLLAALSSLHLVGHDHQAGPAGQRRQTRSTSSRGRPWRHSRSPAANDRPGTQAGVVYRLTNGQLVYVQQAPTK